MPCQPNSCGLSHVLLFVQVLARRLAKKARHARPVHEPDLAEEEPGYCQQGDRTLSWNTKSRTLTNAVQEEDDSGQLIVRQEP